jgi:hypothetical protein
MLARKILFSCLAACFAALLAVACASVLPGCSRMGTTNDTTEIVYEDGSSSESTAISASDAEPVDAPDAEPVTIENSGWWAKDSYVHYGILVTNPNDDLVARDTTVRVTLYDENGQETFSDEAVIGEIGPGETVGFAGETGNGWTPAQVDIEIVEGTTTWTDGTDYVKPVTVDSVSEEDKLYFRYELTGTITNHTSDYVSTVTLYALLLDEDGNIVAGYPGSAYKIKSGQTKSYLQTIHSAPDHASVQLYAQIEN